MSGLDQNTRKQLEAKSDAELYAAAIAGGPEGFAPIVRRYKDAVFGVALARVRDFHAAEDIAQNVLVAAFERLGTLVEPSRLGAWLRSMAIHQSIDHVRGRRAAADVREAMTAGTGSDGPGVQAEQQELRDRVLAAIGRLGKAQRETTTLFYIDGYSVAEVAAIQEVPVGTVKGRLHEARKRLKEELIAMVQDVLKSEAPREDFAGRVFQILSPLRPPTGPNMPWADMVAELRRIGSRGAEGFARALESPHSPVRAIAMALLLTCEAPDTKRLLIELLKKALSDPNRKVRRNATDVILRVGVSDERRRKELTPLVVERLRDPSRRVRRRAAYALARDAAPHVPWQVAARAVVGERDPKMRAFMGQLLGAVLRAQDRGWETDQDLTGPPRHPPRRAGRRPTQ